MSRQGARQQIRPSLAELKDLPTEYDISDPGSDEAEDDDVPTYAPAAKLSRGPAPVLGSASSKLPSTGRGDNDVVRDSSSSQDSVGKTVHFAATEVSDALSGRSQIQDEGGKNRSSASGKRFTVSLDSEREEDVDDDNTNSKLPSVSPLVGIIQERKPATTFSGDTQHKSEKSGQSRFAARRQLDRDAGVALARRREDDVATVRFSNSDAEVWLDEDGQPMSAFRKSRLIKQGLRPPQTRPADAFTGSSGPSVPSSSRLDQHDSTLTSLIQSVSAENEAKIAAMSVEDVEEDIRDLQETFGTSLLEKLKSRRRAGTSGDEAAAKPTKLSTTESLAQETALSESEPNGRRELNPEDDTLASIRRRYFPNEPETVPSSMQWMQDPDFDAHEETHSSEYRFDFNGRQISSSDSKDAATSTVLAGLHHHGDEQDKPGYSVTELLHLARSTLPSQRVMALQTIARIVSFYREVNIDGQHSEHRAISEHLMRVNVRGQACLVSLWYVEDRQSNVRSTAIGCIKSCLTSTLAGPAPIQFVEPPRLRKLKKEAFHRAEEREEGAETRIPSVQDSEVRHGLANSLLHTLQSVTLSDFEVSTALDILVLLAQQSQQIGHFIGTKLEALKAVVTTHLLRGTWPNAKHNTKISVRILQLLRCLIASDRETALSLTASGIVEPILRFVAVPPWALPDEERQVSAWLHMKMALQIYTSLGRYGIASDTYGRNHSVFVTLEQGIRQGAFLEGSAQVQQYSISTLEAILDLLSTWTVCAIDSHRTHGHHDITWSQVSEWWELPISGLESLCKVVPNSENTAPRIFSKGAAFQMLHKWTEGAIKNRAEDLASVLTQVKDATQAYVTAHVKDCASYVQLQIDAMVSQLQKEPICNLTVLSLLERLGCASQALSAVLEFTQSRPDLCMSVEVKALTIATADLLLQRMPWSKLQEEDFAQSGSSGPLCWVTTMLYAALEGFEYDDRASKWLQLLVVLQAGQEHTALDIYDHQLKSCLGVEAKPDLDVLQPFVVELLRRSGGATLRHAPLTSTPDLLVETDTLFLLTQSVTSDENDVDPLSGAALWKCVNAGLPLRRDWPFVALDDLLHSGTCAALNRPDTLPSGWDANELQIVRSSLSLALHLWDSDVTQGTHMPSSAELWMGIIKVFLLEEEQTSNARATGKITGRDIYRDEQVTRSVVRLFSLAQNLDAEHDGDDLERVAERQYGAALPFYQLYTSLVGLYDGISFGYELFGRVLVLGLQTRYSADYRRLLWNDYAHCLATVTTTVGNAPGGLHAYVDRHEDDDGVIRAMSMALLSGSVRKERNGLLFAIATQQLAQLFWSERDPTPHNQLRVRHLAKALFGEQDNDGLGLTAVQQAILAWTRPSRRSDQPPSPPFAALEATAEEQARRLEWIQQQLL